MLSKFRKYLLHELRKKESTVSQLYRLVSEFVAWCDAQGLNPSTARYADLISFMRYLEKQRKSTARINQSFGALRHYYNYLIELGRVKNNPAANIIKAGKRRKAVYSVFTKPELDELYLELPENTDREIVFKCCTGLIVYQGFTTAELGRMLSEHINSIEGKVYITGSSRSNSRELQLEPHQLDLLNRYLDEIRPVMMRRRKKFTRTMFFTSEGGYSMSNVWSYLKEELQKYQPRLKNLRELRNNVIVHWLRSENPIQVKYMAGHRYVSSTEFFQLQDVETLKEELESFFPTV